MTTTTTNDQITAAIGAHGLWKGRLLTAIDTGKCDCDQQKAGRDDQCEFGKWLYGSIDAAMKASPNYASVRDQHARFHKEAAKVLGLALAGQKDAAKKAMAAEYTAASAELLRLLMAWKQ